MRRSGLCHVATCRSKHPAGPASTQGEDAPNVELARVLLTALQSANYALDRLIIRRYEAQPEFASHLVSRTDFALQSAIAMKLYLLLGTCFDFAASANSSRRRIASEREDFSFCCLAQLSISDLSSGGSRTVKTGSRPVAGRPGLFGVTLRVSRRHQRAVDISASNHSEPRNESPHFKIVGGPHRSIDRVVV